MAFIPREFHLFEGQIPSDEVAFLSLFTLTQILLVSSLCCAPACAVPLVNRSKQCMKIGRIYYDGQFKLSPELTMIDYLVILSH